MSGATLVEIWRHPVKSLQGERLTVADVDRDGLRGDRCWGIRDEGTGKILTGRREPRLLEAAATITGDGDPLVTLPDGTVASGLGAATDAALTGWLGRPVTLVAGGGPRRGHAEYFSDALDDTSDPIEWDMPPGRFVDAMPLLVLTTASLRTAAALYPDGEWDVRRFRANLLVDLDGDGWVEDGWCGGRLGVGSAEIGPRQPCVRCTMVTRPQPGLGRDLEIYKTVSHHHGGTLGVWTRVLTAGTVREGDAVEVLAVRAR